MERLDLGELVKVFGGAPVGESAGGVNVGSSRVGVVDGYWGATEHNAELRILLRCSPTPNVFDLIGRNPAFKVECNVQP
jgi:hypothetical protein